MSLDSKEEEILKAIKDLQQEISAAKDELSDQITDNHEELTKKIHVIDSFQRNILEKNQQTIWKKVKDIESEESEEETE